MLVQVFLHHMQARMSWFSGSHQQTTAVAATVVTAGAVLTQQSGCWPARCHGGLWSWLHVAASGYSFMCLEHSQCCPCANQAYGLMDFCPSLLLPFQPLACSTTRTYRSTSSLVNPSAVRPRLCLMQQPQTCHALCRALQVPVVLVPAVAQQQQQVVQAVMETRMMSQCLRS